MSRIALVLAVAVAVTGCRKNTQPVEPVAEVTPARATPAPSVSAAVAELRENFTRVHFAYDSAALSEAARAALDANAAILQRHPSILVEVQGHADERGTTDYNLALGDRRAAAVRERLLLQGVGQGRVRTVSYGEERPMAAGTGETVWSQNRRAEFHIVYGGGASGTTER